MIRHAKYSIGQVVKHRLFDFRGLIFDVDACFSNSEEWYLSIPQEIRPRRDQPFYHLFAENEQTEYVAYVSEQNLLLADNLAPLRHSEIQQMFVTDKAGHYQLRRHHRH